MDDLEPYNTLEAQLCRRATERKIPIYGILELTPLCNMDCEMCFVRLSPAEMRLRGRLRTTEEWLALADQLQKVGTLFLLLTGGEPLLHPGFREIYLGLRRRGFILTLNTNGTLIDEKWADFFAANKPRRINITLYGADKDAYERLCHFPDGFEKAIRAIRLLRERNVDVKVNGTLTPENRKDCLKIYQMAHSLDAACKIDTYLYPAERERNRPFDQQSRLSPAAAAEARVALMQAEKTPESFRNLACEMLQSAAETQAGEAVPGSVRCRAGRSSFTINWQGEMRPCVMLTSPSFPVFDLGFDTAWKRTVEEVDAIRLSPQCSACTRRNVCGVCAASAKLEGGAFDAVPEYVCQYTEETLNQLSKALQSMDAEKEPSIE